MITIDDLVKHDWPLVVRRDGLLADVIDYWDGSGTGLCTETPIRIRVRYREGDRVCDEKNDEHMELVLDA